MNIKKLSISAILTAFSIVIPMFFPKVIIPPFTATLMSHVPIMLAVCISTDIAIFVTVGTSIGFVFAFSAIPFGYLRSFTHVFFVLLACFMLKKTKNVYLTIVITGIVHSVLETAVIMFLFLPADVTPLYAMPILVLGAFIHHIIDAIFTSAVIYPLKKAKMIDRKFNLGKRIV